MKIILTSLFLFLSITSYSQKVVGIRFEEKLTWEQIKEKAKKENKYIFLDFYTTSCVPCRKMKTTIFSKKEVGEFFNENFINVALQIDKTKKDNKHVQKWYLDANKLKTQYNIQAYPTYLFLNPEGNLAHTLIGGDFDVKSFISKAKQALDPKTQYEKLKIEYQNGNRDTSFLLHLIQIAQISDNGTNLSTFINSYLATQSNLLTAKNIKFISQCTTSSKDIGFNILLNYPKKINSIIGNSERNRILYEIAFDEEILPLVRINGKKKIYGGGMIVYEGDINKSPDWDAVKNKVTLKYNDLSNRIMVEAKCDYFLSLKDWDSLNYTLLEYINQEKEVDSELIYRFSWWFLLACNESTQLKKALKWSDILNNTSKTNDYNCYIGLLYKSGEINLALKLLKNYAQHSKSAYENEIYQKLKIGKVFWKN
ncbi:MAG: thioredoxin family protein [Sphingobacteriaceae bacterium]|nr:thioredoxin family protein [Sphingobacteriaceae bacterium]